MKLVLVSGRSSLVLVLTFPSYDIGRTGPEPLIGSFVPTLSWLLLFQSNSGSNLPACSGFKFSAPSMESPPLLTNLFKLKKKLKSYILLC